ncbi:hypothetical protein [Coralloluteibacterium thermophilus]|uniref:Uncharacterized protein n=1 Tax=Coralloluteibacterium thermophilum TaxID=2707049 RepID=A0ABV9NKS3_9GAMM
MRTIRGFRLEPASTCVPAIEGEDVYVPAIHVVGNGVDAVWPCAPGVATAMSLRAANMIAEAYIVAVVDVGPDGMPVFPPLHDVALPA